MGFYFDTRSWIMTHESWYIRHAKIFESQKRKPSLVSVKVTNKIKNFIFCLYYEMTCFMGWLGSNSKDRAYMLFIEFNLF